MNSGVWVNASCYDADYERDFYGMLIDIVELHYLCQSSVTLFLCRWYDSEKFLRVDKHGLHDINYKKLLASNDPFILASQACQVYYTPYPARIRELNDWWAILKIKARSTYNVAATDNQSSDDGRLVDDLYQEDEMGPEVVIEDGDEIVSLRGLREEEEEDEDEDEEDDEDEDEDEEDEEGGRGTRTRTRITGMRTRVKIEMLSRPEP